MHSRIATYNVQFGLKIDKVVDNIQKLSAAGSTYFALQESKSSKCRPPLLDAILTKLGNDWESETFIKRAVMILDYAPCGSPKFYNFGRRPDLLPKLRRFNFYEKVVKKGLIKLVKNPVQRGAPHRNFFNVSGKLLKVCNLHLDCRPFYP